MNIYVNCYSNTSRDASTFIVDMVKVKALADAGSPGYQKVHEALLGAVADKHKSFLVGNQDDPMYECKPDFFKHCCIKPPCHIEVEIDWVQD